MKFNKFPIAILLCISVLSPAYARDEFSNIPYEKLMPNLVEALQISNYLQFTGIRTVLPARIGRALIEQSRGSRFNLLGGLNMEYDQDEEIDGTTFMIDMQFYEIPVIKDALSISGSVRYFGEGDNFENDFDDWNLLRSRDEKNAPDTGITLELEEYRIIYKPLGSLNFDLEAVLFKHLEIGFGRQAYHYQIEKYEIDAYGGTQEPAAQNERIGTTATSFTLNLVGIGELLGFEGTGGELALYNELTYDDDRFYGSTHFIPTGLLIMPALEFSTFSEFDNLMIASVFLDTPPSLLGSLSTRFSFANRSPTLSEFDIFYNLYNPFTFLVWLFDDDAEPYEELVFDTSEQRSAFLRGEPGMMITAGFGATYTNLYPYGIDGVIETEHISPYVSFSIVGADENINGYLDLTIKIDAIDSVPNLLELDNYEESSLGIFNFGIGIRF